MEKDNDTTPIADLSKRVALLEMFVSNLQEQVNWMKHNPGVTANQVACTCTYSGNIQGCWAYGKFICSTCKKPINN